MSTVKIVTEVSEECCDNLVSHSIDLQIA